MFSLFLLNLHSTKFHFDKLIVDRIESNPGPKDYSIEMWFKGYHQGNKKYGETAEVQCTSMPIF